MLNRKGIILVLVVALIFCGFFLIAKPVDYTYNGKEMFYSVEDYTAFKEAIGAEDVSLEEVLVLSSSPPIVVVFTVSVPSNTVFGYGKKAIDGNLFYGILLGLVASFLTYTYLYWKAEV